MEKKFFTIVGKIGRPYGILGWAYLNSFTEVKEDIFRYKPWFLKKKQIVVCKNWKIYKNKFLFSIKNVNNRNKICLLTNQFIFVKQDIFPILKNKSFYWKDLIGCRVFSVNKKYIGKVFNLIDNKFYDILVIKKIKQKINEKEILVPFIEKNFIKNVNLAEKKIIIDFNINT